MQSNKIILTITMILLFSTSIYAEYVFLKNGEIIKGKIKRENSTSVTLKIENKRLKTIKRSRIMRILFTNLYMGQQYVRLTNGKVIQAYKVDEDQDYFTFRKNLYKTKEFKVHRNKILFFARKNPNELTGTPDYTEIDINWKPPIGTVMGYRIYIKKKFDKYGRKPAAKTGKTRYVITGLKSSTDYCVMVTAVDGRGRESLPSNEINIMTKNRNPRVVEEIKCIMTNKYFTKNQNKLIRAHLKWKASNDVDGFTKFYYIYLKHNSDKFKLVHKYKVMKKDKGAKFIEYELKSLLDNEEYIIKVSAVDNRGAASPLSDELKFSTENRPPFPVSEIKSIKEKYMGGRTINASLKWKKGIDRDGIITKYLLYKKTGRSFKKIGTTVKTAYTLPGLSLNKKHIFQVRAVDNRNAQSKENRTVKISTYNKAPCAPKKVRITSSQGTENLQNAKIYWKKADDPDGVVVKYRIYKNGILSPKRIGETRNTFYEARGLDPKDKNKFWVRSVDNRNMESINSIANPLFIFNIRASIPFLMPAGNFNKMFSYGSGAMVNIFLDNFFFYDFNTGIKTGYYYFTGKHIALSNYQMIPILLSTEYSFTLHDIFEITLSASFGGSYNTTYYSDYAFEGKYILLFGVPANGKKSAFQPLMQAGVGFEYLFSSKYSLGLGAEYGGIIEKNGVMHFLSITASFGIRL